MLYQLNGVRLNPTQQFVVGEGDEAVTYPANWISLSTKAEREAIGIVDIEEPPEQVAAELVSQWNASIDAQIKALEGGSPMERFYREQAIKDAIDKALAILQQSNPAATSDMVVVALTNPDSPYFSAGFTKGWNYNQQIIALRHQRK